MGEREPQKKIVQRSADETHRRLGSPTITPEQNLVEGLIAKADRISQLIKQRPLYERYGMQDVVEKLQTADRLLDRMIRRELRKRAQEFVVFEAPKSPKKEAKARAEARAKSEEKGKREVARKAKKEKAKSAKRKETKSVKKEVKKPKKKEARPVTFELDGKKVRGKAGLVLRRFRQFKNEETSVDSIAKITGLSKEEVSRAIGYARKYILPGTQFEIKSVVSDPETGESRIVEPEMVLEVGQKVNYIFREKTAESFSKVTTESPIAPEPISEERPLSTSPREGITEPY